MKTFFRVAAIFFALGIVGNLLDGEFSPMVLVVTIVCTYFGLMHDFSKKSKEDGRIKQEANEKKEHLNDGEKVELLKKLFLKPEENNAIKIPASERFTEAQKHALICCLYVIAVGDDEVHHRELEFISIVAEKLKYQNFDEAKIVSNILNNREMIIEIIRGFDKYQRKYLMYCFDGIIKADFEVKEVELTYAGSIIEQAGFSIEEFESILIRK